MGKLEDGRYVAQFISGTWEGDLKRVRLRELLEWAKEFDSAAPEAVEILREEIKALSE